ncbi:hypothetical protein ATANTOWER_028303 [Ataeniobius toweri]|uniref:Electron transfer flavoprotein beta subunit lysine methyltransferase n=1 Tax=Ataeniobius toweri TaxID=208326 RepID=A0ABU7BBX8_9TELE|nr:hypothetical protein [Ataeniobius toweri]
MADGWTRHFFRNLSERNESCLSYFLEVAGTVVRDGVMLRCCRHVKGFLKPLAETSRRRRISAPCLSEEHIRRFISENTEVVVGRSLTPEIQLKLFTPNCRFWRERPELWPFTDPYWAIYWPGGQALSRYILDNPGVCRGRAVLDLGSGCGASSIAAKLCYAAHVVASDLDPGMII